MSDLCLAFNSVLIGTKGNEALLVRARCKQWKCPYCCKRNRKIWRGIIHDAVQAIGGTWYFMTITAHKNAHKANKSLVNIQNGWKRLVERIKRRCNYKLHYVRVYEQHKSGEIHAHFIINWTPSDYKEPVEKNGPGSQWLKDAAAECGMGYITHIKEIKGRPGKVVNYITKYMTKELQDIPKGIRRVQTTQRFKQPAEGYDSDYVWRLFVKFTIHDLKAYWRLGIEPIDIDRGIPVTYDDFNETDYSPVIDKS